jgi:acyl-CoA synthetase (AMP-forming)/AMP-acid ligase II
MSFVADRFLDVADRLGDRVALIRGGEATSFAELAADVRSLAAGLRRAGLKSGERVALLVPPSRDFYALTFALFRLGAVPVFIDPGIGVRNMGRCLAETSPVAFLGSPKAHLARMAARWAPSARLAVVADGKIPGLWNTRELRAMGRGAAEWETTNSADAPAAVLFTSGSTGAPKGAVYTQAMFAAQLDRLSGLFDIREGETSVATFPLFGLFDAALGQTCVLPNMDFTRPAHVDPGEIIRCLQRREAQQLFGSPALLDRVGRYGERHGIALPHLKRVLSAGAPVPANTLERFQRMLSTGARLLTPYGATEALPVAVIDADEILRDTAALSREGRGVCVGVPVPGVSVSVIRVSDEPIAAWSDGLLARAGEVGEITVKGPVVSREYYGRPEETRAAKIPDGEGFRHRMGDLGYFDERGRLWFCGRKSQRVRTAAGDVPTVSIEQVYNADPRVRRTALVGVGGRAVLCVELEPAQRADERLTRDLLALGDRALRPNPVSEILYHPSFPVDVRHNAKISREVLAVWAAARVKG